MDPIITSRRWIEEMDSKLSDYLNWLTKELSNRSWSRRELARRAGVSHTWVADVINGREPSWDFCAAIAPAFDMSPVEMLLLARKLTPSDVRRALPMLPENEIDKSEQLTAIVRELSEEHQQALLTIAHGLVKTETQSTNQGTILQ